MADHRIAVSDNSPDGMASGAEFSVDQFRLLADNVPALIATYDA